MLRTGSDGSLGALLAAFASLLGQHADETAGFRDALASIEPLRPAPAIASRPLPVLAWWDACLAQPGPPLARAIAAALDELQPALAFTQNPNYVAEPPSAGFLERYGYAVLAGPRSGPPALAEAPDLALGVLLLGPGTTYPTHVHPAAELYLPLGAASWSVGDAPFGPRPAGEPIVHRPGEPHATRTAATPLAALYLWLGSLDVAARIVAPELTPP